MNFNPKAVFDFFDLRSVRLSPLQNTFRRLGIIEICRIIYQKKGILLIYNKLKTSLKNIASEKSYSHFSEHI